MVHILYDKNKTRINFSSQKWQHTSVDENTNAQFVVKLVGYKVEDHLQKVFIEKFYDQKKIYEKKSLD